ncbi:MAG: hypothetical protein CVV42_13625 [Candidatus Riflebacteria bacterium HGW-Riflebacteria-2]|jgi:hypothetical protein|nr:MAG: hypothetical protein CVV42_13625 [Candidatus Riflebacteria bacterium HGW-Riflebacteria-2]
MKISGREFLRNLSEFFSESNYEAEIILMLILPVSALVIFIFFINSRRASANPFESIPAKDMEFIDSARLQKGLEEFDRDFLLELALTYKVKPGYIFIDPEVFVRVETGFRLQLIEDGETPENNTRFKHLLKLKKKLFPGV